MKQLWRILVRRYLPIVVLLLLALPIYGQQAETPPVVSAEWLAANSNLNNIVLLDVRSQAEYQAGHIAASISAPLEVPVSAWIIIRDDLLFEVPAQEELFKTLGALGITTDSLVVTITSGPAEPPYPLANPNRVAATLRYAGVRDVAVLDGGYAKWVAEGRPTTTDIPNVTPTTFQGQVDTAMFVSKEYVKKQIETPGSSIIVDARDEAVYTGSVVEPYADKAGHISTAKSLPTVWIWNADGTYKSEAELAAMASAVVGDQKDQEIIVYCGVGGYASSWWFVLDEVLGYTNVKFYDGSAQEWVRSEDMVLN